jgi:hypothetical protein
VRRDRLLVLATRVPRAPQAREDARLFDGVAQLAKRDQGLRQVAERLLRVALSPVHHAQATVGAAAYQQVV